MSDEENKRAWESEHYNAWLTRFGSPEQYAIKIMAEPHKLLGSLMPLMGEVSGKSILNLMGSNGNKAVALAHLGAQVTILDLSESNRQYALDLAHASNLEINYLVGDVLTFPLESTYDIVFAEMGILHYFTSLAPFFNRIKEWLKPGGKCLIRDFHPVSTKLIVSRGSTAKVRKHKVEGDYFDTQLVEKIVSYGKYAEHEAPIKVYLRNWNLGEIITAAAKEGLFIRSLIEEPNLSSEVYDQGIPKTFILEAQRL